MKKLTCPLMYANKNLFDYCLEDSCAWYIPEAKNCAIPEIARVELRKLREDEHDNDSR